MERRTVVIEQVFPEGTRMIGQTVHWAVSLKSLIPVVFAFHALHSLRQRDRLAANVHVADHVDLVKLVATWLAHPDGRGLNVAYRLGDGPA